MDSQSVEAFYNDEDFLEEMEEEYPDFHLDRPAISSAQPGASGDNSSGPAVRNPPPPLSVTSGGSVKRNNTVIKDPASSGIVKRRNLGKIQQPNHQLSSGGVRSVSNRNGNDHYEVVNETETNIQAEVDADEIIPFENRIYALNTPLTRPPYMDNHDPGCDGIGVQFSK